MTRTVALHIGKQLGSYEITSLVGKGGMGEVFRARDTKLGRDVALKVLPDEFAQDPERHSRFHREAQLLASLNHPNIAQIYGFEESQASRCIVMELVEGDTLAERLRRNPIPVEEALPIAKQIAEGLEAAHERGVIHRDLKPGNIKLAPDGTVKILDFGLAKMREPKDARANLSNSPTMMSVSTPGIIMGTAAYMPPEQAKGKETDRTGDVWAFGCVLYEMLTGRAVFEGETVSEIFAAILRGEPDWTKLPADTPQGIRRLLQRCLRKDQKQRLQYIGDARIEIQDALSEPQVESGVAPVASRGRERLVWIGCLLAVTVVAVAAAVLAWRPVPSPPEVRLEINTPPTSDDVSMAVSPDGLKIVFVSSTEGQSRLWLRSLDSVKAQPLASTEGASYPFWSPDGQSIGFFAGGRLKRIEIDGGAVQTLANAGSGRGGTWNREGTILFTSIAGSVPIFRVSAAAGGEPAAVTQLEPGHASHRFPQFLPDGRHFLYYVQGTPEVRGVYVRQLDGSVAKRLFDADSAASYTSSGHLLFVRQGKLFAQNFDPDRLTVSGNPFLVADQVALGVGAQGAAALSASISGPIAYRTASAGGLRQLVWFDRSGKELAKVGDPVQAFSPTLSPDGNHVAVTQLLDSNYDVWLLDLRRGVFRRLTTDPSLDLYPIWSPDGRVIFSSNRKGVYDLYQKSATGAGAEELVLATTENKTVPNDWSADGRFVLYRNLDAKLGYDIWALPLDGDRKQFAVVQTNFEERDPQFSPDGKWIAYQSDESGRFEVYVQPFPGPGNKDLLSNTGGAQVRWRRDGKELFYIALDGRLMAVPIRFSSNGQTLDVGTPVPLFGTHIGGAVQDPWKQQYDSPDGQRFLMSTVTEEAAAPITVILNWRPK